MRLIAAIIAALILAATSGAIADTLAESNEDFIRKHAKEVAAEFAPNLPTQISENLTIRTVIAMDTTVTLVAMLAYDYDYLKSAATAGGVTPESLKPKMQVMTTNMVCSDKALSAFVQLGGEIQYIYQFSDGVQYMIASVEECSS